MKKRIFNIIIVSIIGILIVGCTAVGAINIPKNSSNDEKHMENNSPQKVEHMDKDKQGEGTDLGEEISTEVEADEKSNDTDNEISGENNQQKDENNVEPEQKPNPGEAKIHYSGDGTRNLVALTFDDGPESEHTSRILDILDEYDIKATFFVIGQNAAKYPEVLKTIYEKGHEIGNHSWSHKYLPKLSQESMKKEVLMTEELLIDILGDYTPIFRPPYGAIKLQGKQTLNSLGYKIVNWSVDTRDWAGTSGEQMMKYVEQQLKPGGIVLMHNGGNTKSVKNTVEILPTMIEWIREQGYEFVTVTEILE